ncbi:hypothetical protein Ndes2526A_g04963 [Nannochloris sp. 'desiccata']
MGLPRTPAARKTARALRIAILVPLLCLVVLVFLNRDSPYLQKSGIGFFKQGSRDSGRVLRSSSPTQRALVGDDGISPENQLIIVKGASSDTDTGGENEPSSDRQDSMVAKALNHVQKVADRDASLRWENDDPETDAARSEALQHMMGLISDGEGQNEIDSDVSTERARRSKDMIEAISRPWDKEPEFFSEACNYDVPNGCSTNATLDYITRVLRAPRYSGFDGAVAQYEASTHYSRNGHRLAAGIFEIFPWVKIIASLREPISRASSMLVHLVDKNVSGGGCLALNNMDLGFCLLNDSHISGADYGGPTEYYVPLKAWVDAFPKHQIFLVQYENLTHLETETGELVRMKNFLGIDPKLPEGKFATLGMNNARKGRINPDGWPMKRKVYEKIISVVRPDCEAVARMVTKKGFGDGNAWLRNWEKVWEDNLNSCNADGDCIIQLS